MATNIATGEDARRSVKVGIDRAASIVRETLGVRGRNVILDTNEYTKPINTNDGVTILRELSFDDPFENVGLEHIREAAQRTNDVAGDGTTTASVLMQSIVDYGNRAIIAGADAVLLRRGIEQATASIIKSLKREAIKSSTLETLIDTAVISCGDENLGKIVAGVVHEAGVDGVVTLEDNPEPDTVTEQAEGIKLRGGYIVPNYINVPELQQVSLTDTPIVVTNQSIASGNEMAKIMEAAFKKGKKQVVVVANSIEGEALITSLKNWLENKFHALPIRVISYGEMGEGILRDLAAMTGAKFFDSAANQNVFDITPEDLGTVEKIVVGRHESTVITKGDTKARIKELQAQIKATDREFERESLRERIAKLNNALYTIKVGGITETERNERKLRVEDAINATRAALTDGVVAGGGSALYRGSIALARSEEDFSVTMGYVAVEKACLEPIEQMAKNASHRLDRSDLEAIKDKSKAIDFKTGTVVDAFSTGIIDPVKVVVSALENAASAAALFLTTSAVVTKKKTQDEEQI